ncbi:MAG: DMT family transporter [Actinobacteria bacterium]|nr:DMT family transporter [Actinomycetota bacterium]
MVVRRSVPFIATFIVGCLTAVQARMNGQLAVAVGDGLEAAVFSFGSGLVLVTIIAIVFPRIRHGVARIPGAIASGELAWWQILGGVMGGFFVGVQSATVPLLGVAVFSVATVAGQSSNSLLVDRAGLGPAGKQPITAPRVVSAVLAIIAVAIAVSNRFQSGNLSILALFLAFCAGLLIAVQAAINGRVARATQHPMSAAWLNFFFGTAALAAAFGLAWAFTDVDPTVPSDGPWWMYLGGVVGLAFIAIASWVVPIVGVLYFALTSIAGQLSGALLLDVFAPTAGTDLAWNLVVGVLVAFGAVLVAARGRSRA